MEDLVTAIGLNEVPGRHLFSLCKWVKKAWPSKKLISCWFQDMFLHSPQLEAWKSDFNTPYSM
ncbi:unnamed protein product [Albugo candida]|uniref:Uncharacterized protein n=1 Tax=Albugo candida TaxID=65357 RepID=A0A024GUD4_9STRA|nr:unnamed protein product [Albugo candida]|eukprot:CCI50409.1 unnamed protein product [Albugo candida]